MNLPCNSGTGRWEGKIPDQKRNQLMMGQQKGYVLWQLAVSGLVWANKAQRK